MDAFDLLDRRKKADAELNAVGTATLQKAVVKAFAVPNSMAGEIETKQRNYYQVELFRFGLFISNRFAYSPCILDHGRICIELDALDLSAFWIDPRCVGLHREPLPPDPKINVRGVKFVEFGNSNEGMEPFHLPMVDLIEVPLSDLVACRRNSRRRQRTALVQVKPT